MRPKLTALAGLPFVFAIAAQGQVSPTPVVNEEVRDPNSVRMRAVQLERIKRGVGNLDPRRSLAGDETEFRKVREDFEEIQKTQDEIVRVYTTSRKIDFGRIEELAGEISVRAARLESALFGGAGEKEPASEGETRPVRDLIVLLDDAIGKFVSAPMFSDPRLVDPSSAEKSQADLALVVKLSSELVRSAGLNR